MLAHQEDRECSADYELVIVSSGDVLAEASSSQGVKCSNHVLKPCA